MIDEITKKNAKKNIKIYKSYKMFAYDWLFYYAISVLFLTIIKRFFYVTNTIYYGILFTIFYDFSIIL